LLLFQRGLGLLSGDQEPLDTGDIPISGLLNGLLLLGNELVKSLVLLDDLGVLAPESGADSGLAARSVGRTEVSKELICSVSNHDTSA
jgi:hypothetical protein